MSYDAWCQLIHHQLVWVPSLACLVLPSPGLLGHVWCKHWQTQRFLGGAFVVCAVLLADAQTHTTSSELLFSLPETYQRVQRFKNKCCESIRSRSLNFLIISYPAEPTSSLWLHHTSPDRTFVFPYTLSGFTFNAPQWTNMGWHWMYSTTLVHYRFFKVWGCVDSSWRSWVIVDG